MAAKRKNVGGRPKKTVGKRDKYLVVALTAEERATVNAALEVSGERMASMARRAILAEARRIQRGA